jgi:hypothetical protein
LRQALVALNLFFVALKSAATQFEKKSQLENVKWKFTLKRFRNFNNSLSKLSFRKIQYTTGTTWILNVLNVRGTLLSEEIEDFFTLFSAFSSRKRNAPKGIKRRLCGDKLMPSNLRYWRIYVFRGIKWSLRTKGWRGCSNLWKIHKTRRIFYSRLWSVENKVSFWASFFCIFIG